MKYLVLLLGAFLQGAALWGQNPGEAQWVWGSWYQPGTNPGNQEECYLRLEFELDHPVESAEVSVSADNHFILYINGRRVAHGDNWTVAETHTVGNDLRKGWNVIGIHARNDSGPAAVLTFGEIRLKDGTRLRMESSSDWLSHRQPDADWLNPGADVSLWLPAHEIGPYGTGVWQNVTWTSSSSFETLPGFEVDKLASGHGSLISVCLNQEGDIFAGREGNGIAWLQDGDNDGVYEESQLVAEALKHVQGLCWHQDRFFAVGQGPAGPGLYEIKPDGELIRHGEFTGGGEHGPHAVIPGPDEKLYVALGNHSEMRSAIGTASPFQLVYEGYLIPRLVDPRGHATKIQAPGGVLYSYDPQTSEWTALAGGLRNSYDIAFSEEGDLFTYDSDMEWDIGLPWYRPTRIYHVVPGADFGWRTGASKFPSEYPDALPPVLEVGRGSPTGLTRYDGKQFPSRFHGSLLGGDWSQGYILAFHLQHDGYSYTADSEPLLRGRPLNVTDLETAADGSLIFTTGGRGTYGAVYRLSYPFEKEVNAPIRNRQRRWVGFYERADLDTLLERLSSDHASVRYASLRQLEAYPLEQWFSHVVTQVQTPGGAEAMVAVARVQQQAEGAAEIGQTLRVLWEALPEAASPQVRVALLRALELTWTNPDAPEPAKLSADWGPVLLDLFPTGDRISDRLLSQLLAYLRPEGAIEKLLGELDGHPFREEQFHFAYCLRFFKSGWSATQRARFMNWFATARNWRGGFSFEGYLRNIRLEFEEVLEDGEKQQLNQLLEKPRTQSVLASGNSEPLDFERTLTFLNQTLREPRRDLREGERVFEAVCSACHQVGNRGRGVGPELTAVAGRFSMPDLLETVLRPSRQISDQYQALDVWTQDGDVFTGMPLTDDERGVLLFLGDQTERFISADQIKEKNISSLSLMPEALLDPFSWEEIADLFAFLLATEEERQEVIEEGEAWDPLFSPSRSEIVDWQEGWTLKNGIVIAQAQTTVRDSREISHQLIIREQRNLSLEIDVRLIQGSAGLLLGFEEGSISGSGGVHIHFGDQRWSSLYENDSKKLLSAAAPELWKPSLDPLGWNHLFVQIEGQRIRVEMNGITTIDFRAPQVIKGGIALRTVGSTSEVQFRNLRIRPQ